MLPIQRKISPYNHYDYNNPSWIIIHYVGAASTAKNNADYFNSGNRNASAHYFVDDNTIYQVVEDFKGAWHIGNSVKQPNNWNSIGIEMCCQNDGNLTVSTATENNTVELVQYLMKKYNIDIDHVVTHAWTTGFSKICPNWSANNWARFEGFKRKVSGKTVQPSKEDLYRIRKSWNEAKSQVGAYRYLSGAKQACPIGYNIYDSNGNCVYTNFGDSKPMVTPPTTKEKISIYYKVAIKNRGYYPQVANLNDYAGDLINSCCLLEAHPSKGYVEFRVSPIGSFDYYPVVGNYPTGNYYDEAGLANVPFDKLQMRLVGLEGYVIRYRVYSKTGWLPWIENGSNWSDFAGLGDGYPILGVEIEIV